MLKTYHKYSSNITLFAIALLLLVIRVQSQGSGYTAAIRLIIHPVF
jgi:phosphate starvation-inducible membrane PsiE